MFCTLRIGKQEVPSTARPKLHQMRWVVSDHHWVKWLLPQLIVHIQLLLCSISLIMCIRRQASLGTSSPLQLKTSLNNLLGRSGAFYLPVILTASESAPNFPSLCCLLLVHLWSCICTFSEIWRRRINVSSTWWQVVINCCYNCGNPSHGVACTSVPDESHSPLDSKIHSCISLLLFSSPWYFQFYLWTGQVNTIYHSRLHLACMAWSEYMIYSLQY